MNPDAGDTASMALINLAFLPNATTRGEYPPPPRKYGLDKPGG
jgi:hypothetical protein